MTRKLRLDLKDRRPVLLLAGTAIVVFSLVLAIYPKLIELQLPPIPGPELDDALPHIRNQLTSFHARAEKQPLKAQVVGELGMLFHAYGEYGDAAACYERAKALSPVDFRWPYLLGLAHGKLGKPETAIQNLMDALRLRQYPPAQLELARAQLLIGQSEKGRQILDLLAETHPNIPIVHYELGKHLISASEISLAVTHLQKAINLSPQFGAAHYSLAQALRLQGDIRLANAHLRKYEQFEKIRPPPIDSLMVEIGSLDLGIDQFLRHARFLMSRGQFHSAAEQLEQVLEFDPSNSEANANLITAYGKSGRNQLAEAAYVRALQSTPDWTEAHYLYGRHLVEIGDYEGAINVLETALAQNPSYPDALTQLGLAYEKLDRTNDAVSQYELALSHEPGHRGANLLLGMQLIRLGNTEAGEDHLRLSLEVIDDLTAQYHGVVADFYLQQNEVAKSATHAKAGLEIAKDREQDATASRLRRLLKSIDSQ